MNFLGILDLKIRIKMQIDIVLLFGVVASDLGSMFLALLCSLPGFVLHFFAELGAKKHYIFLALAIVAACYMASTTKDSGSYFILDIFLNLLVIYFGLFLLKALKNMGSRLGFCKACDKFKDKVRKKVRRQNYEENQYN